VHTHPVAEVDGLERVEPVVAHHGLGDEELDLTIAIAHGGEHELARVARQHDAAGNRHAHVGLGTWLQVIVGGAQFGERVGAVEAVRIGVHTS
jgi:hypothetical protein